MRPAPATIFMADNEAQYRLLSWLSPTYPVGAFAYSHGLEYAVGQNRITDVESLIEWIETALLYGTGRIDGVLFRESYKAVEKQDWSTLDDLVELGDAFQPSAEIFLEARSQGNAFLGATSKAWPAPAFARLNGGAVYSIAVGIACAAHGVPVGDGIGGYFHAFAANLVSAGVRLIPLGQSDGQMAIASLEATVGQAKTQAMTIALDDMGTASPLLDLDSMRHETQYSRLFRS